MKNILIIKTGALGDVLRTSSILYGLKEQYPVSRISWVTSKSALPLIQDHPLIHQFYIDSYNIDHNFDKSIKYDLVINLEEDPKIFNKYHKEIYYKQWVGPYGSESLVLYTTDFSPIYDMSLISVYDKQTADMEKVGNNKSYPKLLYQCLGLNWRKQQYRIYGCNTSEMSASDKPRVGVVINAGKRWPMKSMDSKQYIGLIDRIKSMYLDNIEVVLLPGKDDIENAENISKGVGHNILINKPTTLKALISNVNKCDIIITPDTLPMHIGIALDKFVIAYFTVTSAAETEIYKGVKIIPDHPDYCNYSTKDVAHPNITDSIDVDVIAFEMYKILDKE